AHRRVLPRRRPGDLRRDVFARGGGLGEGGLGSFEQRRGGRALPDGAGEEARALPSRAGERRQRDPPHPQGRAPPRGAHAPGTRARGERGLRRDGDRSLTRARAAAAALVALLLTLVGWSPAPVQEVRETLFDSYQRLLPRERRSAPATIVEIDEETLAEYGQWPWPRTLVAELVSRIAEHEPAAIGLDLLFPEPDRFSPAELARLIPLPGNLASRLESLPSNDERLADAIRGRKVVLAIAGLDEQAPRGAPPLRQYGRELASVPEIDRAAAGRGLISVDVPERLVRRVPLVAKIGEEPVPALALELWRVGTGARHFTLSGTDDGLLLVEFADASVPVQRDGTMWLRYSPHDQSHFVSAAEVLDGSADPELIRSKLVLV